LKDSQLCLKRWLQTDGRGSQTEEDAAVAGLEIVRHRDRTLAELSLAVARQRVALINLDARLGTFAWRLHVGHSHVQLCNMVVRVIYDEYGSRFVSYISHRSGSRLVTHTHTPVWTEVR
jgi:hypothetical protein